MITKDKRFIDIQGILAMSDVHPADCIKINDLIIELSKENQKFKERIEYLERSNNRREDTIIEQRQEISDLEDNWNKLKKYIKTEIPEDAFIDTEWFVSILDKMQELEGSNV